MPQFLKSLCTEESTICILNEALPLQHCETCGKAPRIRNYENLELSLVDKALRWEYRLKGWPELLTTYDHFIVSEKIMDRFNKLEITGVEFVPVVSFMNSDWKEIKTPAYFILKSASWVKVYPPEGMTTCEACGYLTFLPDENIYGYKDYKIDPSTWDGAIFVECKNVFSRQRYLPVELGHELLKGIKKTYFSGDRLYLD